MKKIFFTVLFFTVQAVVFCQTLTIDIPEHRYRIDPYNNIIVVQSTTIESYSDLSEYEAIELNLTSHQYYFSEIPDNLVYTGAYTVNNGSEDFHLFFSQLPLLKIQSSVNITSPNKVAAQFYYADENQILIATIGIEFRGGTSTGYPKKSYDIEFWEDADTEISVDVQFGNLREDDDWVLDGMYNEPLRLRAHTASQLWLDIHQPYYQQEEQDARSGAGGYYVELFLNGRYKGIYLLSEQIDRKLLQIEHFDGTIRGELFKGDQWDPGTTFSSAPPYNNANRYWAGYEMKYPKVEDTTDWENLHDFIDFVVNSSEADFEEIWSRFQFQNYLDYFIFLNLGRLTDNTGKNIYIARRDTAAPYFYAPWDLDGCFGTKWDGTQVNITDDIITSGFMDRVLAINPGGYHSAIEARWAELRGGVLNTENLIDRFEYSYNLLKANNVYTREALVFPNYPYDQESFDYIVNWTLNRIEFLDIYFNYEPIIFTQDYLLFNGSEARLYNLESPTEPTSKIIAVEVDEVEFNGDSIYHFASNWYPATGSEDDCMDAYGPSRMGYQMQTQADGTHFLYNFEGDVIELRSNADAGESWTAYTFPDGSGTISATVTQVNSEMVLGISDQVKTIGLQKFDADSVAQVTSIDDLYFKIGKNSGLIATPEIRDFPSSFMLHLKGIEGEDGIQNLTYLNVMDFQPGDEIHIETTEQLTEASVTYEVERYISREDYPDSTVYQIEVTTYSFQGAYSNLLLEPVDTVVIERVITAQPYFDALPATVDLAIGPSSNLDYIWMNEGSHGIEKISRHGDVAYAQNEADSSLFCVYWDSQECNNASNNTYIEGLGGPYYYCEGIESSGIFWRRLKYYQKGDVTWGESLITSVKQPDISEQVRIFPNPVSEKLNIKTPSTALIRELHLRDMQGRPVKSVAGSNSETLNLESIARGVYLLEIVLSSGERVIKKVVVSQ